MEAFRKKSQSEDVKAPIYCRKSGNIATLGGGFAQKKVSFKTPD